MRSQWSTTNSAGIATLLACLFSLLTTVFTSSSSGEETVAALTPRDQVRTLIDSFTAERTPKFPPERFPILFDLKKSSQVVKLFKDAKFDLSDLQEPEKARKIEHRLGHFKFYTDAAFQMRAILYYPVGTNQHTRPAYLQYARNFLPLFREERYWHIVFNNLDLMKGKTDRLPRLFSSETEADMRSQYCAFLRVERQEVRERLRSLVPALRLNKAYECDKEEENEDGFTLGDFFKIFEGEGGQLNIGSSDSEEDEDGDGESERGSSSEDTGYCGGAVGGDSGEQDHEGSHQDDSSDSEPSPDTRARIRVNLHINNGRFNRPCD